MTVMTVNTDLLDRTLAAVEAHPELRDETIQHFGDKACFACHVLLQLTPLAFQDTIWTETPVNGGTQVVELVRTFSGYLPVVQAAAYYLGITEQQADLLFARDNTLDDLRNIVATIKGDR